MDHWRSAAARRHLEAVAQSFELVFVAQVGAQTTLEVVAADAAHLRARNGRMRAHLVLDLCADATTVAAARRDDVITCEKRLKSAYLSVTTPAAQLVGS